MISKNRIIEFIQSLNKEKFEPPSDVKSITDQWYCFLHIPKTGGTSLRTSFEYYFGSERMIDLDEINHRLTKKWVKEEIMIKHDYHKIYQAFLSGKYNFLTGHHFVRPCLPIFPSRNIFSMVRDPVNQVKSHYNHRFRHKKLEDSFESFVNEPKNQNVQSRVLSAIPYNMYGFVGVTEELETCIEIINHLYDMDLFSTERNVNSRPEIKDLDESSKEMILENNAKDVALYDRTKDMYKLRYEMFQKGIPWVHGDVYRQNKERIFGYAYFDKSNEAVEILVHVSNQQSKTILANAFCHFAKAYNAPRNSYVGFSKDHKAKKGDELKIEVVQTGEIIYQGHIEG